MNNCLVLFQERNMVYKHTFSAYFRFSSKSLQLTVNSRSFVVQYKNVWVCASCNVFITAGTGGIVPKNLINLFFGDVYPEYFFFFCLKITFNRSCWF